MRALHKKEREHEKRDDERRKEKTEAGIEPRLFKVREGVVKEYC